MAQRVKRLYESPNLAAFKQRQAILKQRKTPLMQKKLFCARLYHAWLDSLNEGDLNKIVNQLIKQGHEFRMGKE